MLTFTDLLDDMASSLDQPNPELLVLLIDRLRPASSRDLEDIHYRITRLIDTLRASPARRRVLHDYVLSLLSRYHQVGLYADSGILGNEAFFTAIKQRIGWRILPPLRQATQLRDLFDLCFHHSTDARWVANITEEDWQTLFWLLRDLDGSGQLINETRSRILSAIMIVSYRITSIGIEPELIRAHPAINEFKSPFLVQNREVIDYVEDFKRRLYADTAQLIELPIPDERQALVILDQCRDILSKIKKNTRKQGVSLSLSNLLIRLEQCLNRIELLFELLSHDAAQSRQALAELLRLLARAQREQSSVRALISINTELMAQQVTENASRTGDHYVTTDRTGYWSMYRSAAGAGAIIALMATLKILSGRLVLAPFTRAFISSMNYSLGFMLIHMLHFTVATKQPAMTAATLAAAVQRNTGNRQAQIAELAAVTMNIMRTQFIAILGNISIAMPIAFLITWLISTQTGAPLMTPYKAEALLHDINPFISLAIPHAAIAGVWLFVSGLIAGYYDNLAVYHQVGARLKQHARLQRWLGQPRLDRMAGYVERNLGALAGNFWFGIMLGSTATFGYILGLPLDIRHIAFASANFSQGLYNLDEVPELGLVLVSFLGVLLIGMTNLMVSFGLALFVALRARRVQYSQWRPLLKLLFGHFLTRPADFFWPPKTPTAPPSTSGNKTDH
mgnify:CR=1 FL=1